MHLRGGRLREVAPVDRPGRVRRQRAPQVLVQRLAEEGREGRHHLRVTASRHPISDTAQLCLLWQQATASSQK